MKVVFFAASDIKPGEKVAIVTWVAGSGGRQVPVTTVHTVRNWEGHGNGLASLYATDGTHLGQYERNALIAVPNSNGRNSTEAIPALAAYKAANH